MVQVMNKISRLKWLVSKAAWIILCFCCAHRHRDTQITYTHTHARAQTQWQSSKGVNDILRSFTGHEFFFIHTLSHTRTRTNTHAHADTRTHAQLRNLHTQDTALQILGSELHYGGCNTSRVVIPPPPAMPARMHTHTHTHTHALSFP